MKKILSSIIYSIVLSGCITVTVESPEEPASETDGTITPVLNNRSPVLSGTPGTQIELNSPYTFTASATDADNDPLTFSISNKPDWATFDSTTGTLSGTPTLEGEYQGIVIGVSDGKSSVQLTAFNLVVTAPVLPETPSAYSVTIQWQAPTQNINNEASEPLVAYKIFYGSDAGNPTHTLTVTNGEITEYQVTDLSSGGYYFSMSAITESGMESEPSAEFYYQVGI